MPPSLVAKTCSELIHWGQCATGSNSPIHRRYATLPSRRCAVQKLVFAALTGQGIATQSTPGSIQGDRDTLSLSKGPFVNPFSFKLVRVE